MQENRPKSSGFYQQRLPAWQPLFTTSKIMIYFFCFGIVLLALGFLLLFTALSVNEFSIDYTECFKIGTNISCASILSQQMQQNYILDCRCQLTLTTNVNLKAPIYVYYGLKNFYQNHRLYVKSRDDKQLKGITGDLSADCAPFISPSGSVSGPDKYAPCGLIANSLFNDEFTLNKPDGSMVSWTNKGISWSTDKDVKFGKVADWSGYTKPPNWRYSAQERSADAYSGDEELIVWMRPAALSTFRKPHRIITEDLLAGNYTLLLKYYFPVTQFSGSKTFIISTTNWLGGRNLRIGIAYLVAACIHLVLGVAFFVIWLRS